jgi:DNA/RNA non-specific endonuclease
MMDPSPALRQADQKADEYESATATLRAIEHRLRALRARRSAAETAGELAPNERDVDALTMRLKEAEAEVARVIAELETLLASNALTMFRGDSAVRPIIAAAPLLEQASRPRARNAEAAVSRPLTQLMEYLRVPQRYHGAHLIPYRYGGPDKGNLVPLEDSVNTSYMAVTENQIGQLMKVPGTRLYLLVRVVYLDPPDELSEGFEARRGINPDSRYRRKAEFSLMELKRVPDEIDYQAIDLETGKAVLHVSFFPGGPLLDYLRVTRAKLEKRDPDLARRLLDREQRRAYIEQLKAQNRA